MRVVLRVPLLAYLHPPSPKAPPSMEEAGASEVDVHKVEVVTKSLTRSKTQKLAASALSASRSAASIAFGLTTDDKKERRQRRPWYILDPRKRTTPQLAWDCIASLALVFTATFTPFEVGFLAPSREPQEALFVTNRVVDFIFFVDLVLTFFTGYQSNPLDTNSALWVFDMRKIAWHYVTSAWFYVDVLSIAVGIFDLLELDMVRGGDRLYGGRLYGDPTLSQLPNATFNASLSGLDTEATAEAFVHLKALRVLRALRLIKLVRLIKASTVLRRWQIRYAINYGYLALVLNVCKVLFVAHMFACLWSLQADFHESRLTSWMGTTSGQYCYRCTYIAGGVDASGTLLPMCPDDPDLMQPHPFLLYACLPCGTIYAASVYWSIMTLTSSALASSPRPPARPFAPSRVSPCAPKPTTQPQAEWTRATLPPTQSAMETSRPARPMPPSCALRRYSCCSLASCGPMSSRASSPSSRTSTRTKTSFACAPPPALDRPMSATLARVRRVALPAQ